MTKERKIDFLISPEKFWPLNIRLKNKKTGAGNILGNEEFIRSLTAHVKLLQESQYWSLDTLRLIQLKRLNLLVKYLSERSPFWANYLKENGFNIRSTKDMLAQLVTLPVTDRRIYSEVNKDDHHRDKLYILPRNTDTQIIDFRTGGTTGLPATIKRGARENVLMKYPFHWRYSSIFTKKMLEEMYEKKYLIMLGGGGNIFNHADYIHAHFSISHSELEDGSLRKTIYKTIRDNGSTILSGYGSLISKFSQYVVTDCVSLPLIAIRTASEPISLHERKSIRKNLGVPVLNALNSLEAGMMAFECQEHMGNFHINTERIIVEIVDKDNNVLGENKDGDIVVTTLDSFTSPILRYKTGDTGKLISSPCPCGRTLPRLEFLGRRHERLILPSGKSIPVILLHKALAKNRFNKTTLQFQIRQVAPNKLQIHVIPTKNFTEREETNVRIALTKLFSPLEAEKMLIDVIRVNKISPTSSGKPKFFIPLHNN